MFTLTIETDNAAFEEAGTTSEVARILRELADDLERSYFQSAEKGGDPVHDANGNTVGRWELNREPAYHPLVSLETGRESHAAGSALVDGFVRLIPTETEGTFEAPDGSRWVGCTDGVWRPAG